MILDVDIEVIFCYNTGSELIQKARNRQMIQVPEQFQTDLDLAIKILKEVGCTEIFIFNSLAREDSDIDLAIRGCPPSIFFKTWGRLLRELKHTVNLVDLDSKEPYGKYLEKRGELKRVA